MSIRATCPECGALFHLQADSAGTKVRCGTCLSVFTVPVDAPPATAERGAASSGLPRAFRTGRAVSSYRPQKTRTKRYIEDEADDDFDRPRRKRPRKQSPAKAILIVLGLLFGIKLVAGLMVAAIILLTDDNRRRPATQPPVWANEHEPPMFGPQPEPPRWQPPQWQPPPPQPPIRPGPPQGWPPRRDPPFGPRGPRNPGPPQFPGP
jgi:predicted Zn finger-like uncharacterized protein